MNNRYWNVILFCWITKLLPRLGLELKWAWLTHPVLLEFFLEKHSTLLFIPSIPPPSSFPGSVNAGIVYYEKVIRVVKRSGLCRDDLIEVVEVSLAQWVMDAQQRGASSLAQWLKLMGTYGAAASSGLPGARLSFGAHLFGTLCWSIKGASCLLWGLAGEKNTHLRKKEACLVVGDKCYSEQSRL